MWFEIKHSVSCSRMGNVFVEQIAWNSKARNGATTQKPMTMIGDVEF